MIDLAPNQWQGYTRSARLFLQLNKHETALKMLKLAMERIKENDTKRRVEVEALKQQIVDSAKTLDERKHRHASRAYHGEKLPVEIFGEIFGLLVASDVTQAIMVSHVCKHWRAVALSTPSLWRTLVLAKKDPARKTKEWIKRSQGQIRELCIRIKFEDSRVPLSSALLGFPWNHLRVCRLNNVSSLAVCKMLAGLHILSNLVELEDAGRGEVIKDIFQYRIPKSKLRFLTIRNRSLNWDILSGFTHLESLVIKDSVLTLHGDVRRIMEFNPMLERIILDLIPVHSTVGNVLPLTMSHLTHLEIAGLSANNFCDITMPSLRILRMTRVGAGVDTLLTSILKQGPSDLIELGIHSSYFTTSKLVSFLRAASSLEAFGLSFADEQANAVVEALASNPSNLSPGSSPSPLENFTCPLLAHLELSSCPYLKTGPVVRLVKCRLPAITPELSGDTPPANRGVTVVAQIETLIVDRCPLIEPEVLPWLRSKVRTVSCVYATKKDAQWRR